MGVSYTSELSVDRLISDEAMRKATEYACLLVENRAKELCPVDTGQLRGSITHYVEQLGPCDYEGVVGTNVEYAPYIEFGTGLFASDGDGRKTPWSYQDAEGNWHTTKGMRPQPFLQPALDQMREEIIYTAQQILAGGSNNG